MAIKIACATLKGGIGKTTTALNLADNLMREGKKVLMIDADGQRNTTDVYRARYDSVPTLYDMIINDHSAKNCIQKTAYGDIIPCDPLLFNADTLIPAGPKMYKYLKHHIPPLDEMYDYIIFDTRGGVLLGNVLMVCDYIIIPIIYDLFGIAGLLDFYDIIQEFQEDNPCKILGLLPIKYKKNLNLVKEVEEPLQNCAKRMNTKVFETRIRESVRCQEAQLLRMRLSEYRPHCSTAEDYAKLVKEIIKEVE